MSGTLSSILPIGSNPENEQPQKSHPALFNSKESLESNIHEFQGSKDMRN